MGSLADRLSGAATGGRGASWTLPLIAVMLLSGPARGAFDLEFKTPAERGAATHMALGRLEGSFHLPLLDRAGRACPPGISLNGFKPFGTGEVQALAAWAAFPLGNRGDGMCLAYERLGGLSYTEEAVTLRGSVESAGVRFMPAIRSGLVRFEGRAIDSAVLLDMAIAVRLPADIRVALIAENPLGNLVGGTANRGPASIRTGLSCLISPGLAWGMEVSKHTRRPTSVATGIEASIAGGVFVRSGLRSEPRELSVGLGLAAGGVGVDVATGYNLLLGTTHEIGLTYVRW